MNNAKLTQDELHAIKERAEKATAGPWVTDASYGGVHTQHPNHQDVSRSWSGRSHPGICNVWDGEYIENSNRESDAEFIAASRQDIPRLVAEVERLQTELSSAVEFADFRLKYSEQLSTELAIAWANVERLQGVLKTIAYECDELIADGYIEESGVVDIRNIAREALK